MVNAPGLYVCHDAHTAEGGRQLVDRLFILVVLHEIHERLDAVDFINQGKETHDFSRGLLTLGSSKGCVSPFCI